MRIIDNKVYSIRVTGLRDSDASKQRYILHALITFLGVVSELKNLKAQNG